MSRFFTNLIDISVLPALTLFVSKFFSVKLVIFAFGIDTISSNTNSLSAGIQSLVSAKDIVFVSTMSDLLTFVSVFSIFSFFLVKVLYFTPNKISPVQAFRIVANGNIEILKSSYTIYSKALINLAFVWINVVLILLNSVFGHTNFLLFGFTFCLTLIVTTTLIIDLYQEFYSLKQSPSKFSLI